MIPCKVERHYDGIIVTFPEENCDILFQGDDVHSFMENCGLNPEEDDPADIEECCAEYLDIAEPIQN